MKNWPELPRDRWKPQKCLAFWTWNNEENLLRKQQEWAELVWTGFKLVWTCPSGAMPAGKNNKCSKNLTTIQKSWLLAGFEQTSFWLVLASMANTWKLFVKVQILQGDILKKNATEWFEKTVFRMINFKSFQPPKNPFDDVTLAIKELPS